MSLNLIAGIERPGVLNEEQIKELTKGKIIEGWSSGDDDIGLSSIDIHLSGRCWELPAGFKCREGQTIRNIIQSAKHKIKGIKETTIPEGGLFISKNKTYLFEIQEMINLPIGLFGHGTGRSSIGRLDVLTRLLADEEGKYDSVTPGNRKNLYVEVTPLSFPIVLYTGDPIYQLRIVVGEFNWLQITKDLLKLYSVMMKNENGEPITGDMQTCLRLNLDPTPIKGITDSVIAFKAKKDINSQDPLNPNAEDGTYSPEDYWEPITANSDEVTEINGEIALRVARDAFYILRSQERFTLPSDIAVYGVAMTEEVGELRIHHAGFVHPYFGSVRGDKRGTPLIFEDRGHNLDMYLVQGDLMAELRYYPMSKQAKLKRKKKKDYEDQELNLANIFGDFGDAN